MTTSKYGGLVAWEQSVELAGGGQSLPCGFVDDVLANNTEHFDDEQCQPLVDWIAPTSGQFASWVTATAAASSPSPVRAYDLLLHPRPNGKPPILVVECMGAWGSNSGTVTFIVGIVGPGDTAYDLGGSGPVAPASGVDAVTFSFASATPAWATPKTLIFNDRKTLDSLRQSFGGAGTIYARANAGGSPASVDLIQARLEVWCYSTSTSTQPLLFGLQVREFCGTGV